MKDAGVMLEKARQALETELIFWKQPITNQYGTQTREEYHASLRSWATALIASHADVTSQWKSAPTREKDLIATELKMI